MTPRRISLYPKAFLTAYVISSILWMSWSFHGLVTPTGTPVGGDFVNTWAGSYLALSGHSEQVYDFWKIHEAEKAAVHARNVSVFGWYYPPTYLLIVLPLALLPYLWALAAWTLATLAAYLSVLRRLAPFKETLWLALAFPGTFVNLINGQNGFLSAALLGGGVAYLENRPMLAGCLFGLLVFKPHLGILIPLALVVTRQWRCLLAAGVSSVGFVGLSLLAFGSEMWRAFFHTIPVAQSLILDQGLIPYAYQQSVLAALRLWYVPVRISYTVQAIVSLPVALALVWVWTINCSARLKGAALVISGLLATPYLFDYDLTSLGIAIALLATEGLENGFLPFEKTALILAYLAPVASRVVAKYALIPMCPLLELSLLAFTVVHAVRFRCGGAERAAAIAGREF